MAYFAATRLPASDCPECLHSPQVKIDPGVTVIVTVVIGTVVIVTVVIVIIVTLLTEVRIIIVANWNIRLLF